MSPLMDQEVWAWGNCWVKFLITCSPFIWLIQVFISLNVVPFFALSQLDSQFLESQMQRLLGDISDHNKFLFDCEKLCLAIWRKQSPRYRYLTKDVKTQRISYQNFTSENFLKKISKWSVWVHLHWSQWSAGEHCFIFSLF